jgi:hypothetical protein
MSSSSSYLQNCAKQMERFHMDAIKACKSNILTTMGDFKNNYNGINKKLSDNDLSHVDSYNLNNQISYKNRTAPTRKTSALFVGKTFETCSMLAHSNIKDLEGWIITLYKTVMREVFPSIDCEAAISKMQFNEKYVSGFSYKCICGKPNLVLNALFKIAAKVDLIIQVIQIYYAASHGDDGISEQEFIKLNHALNDHFMVAMIHLKEVESILNITENVCKLTISN